MKNKLSYYLLILLMSILGAKNPWNGLSVATSDNLDALSFNPAGLGINRGEQSGFFLPIEDNNITSVHTTSRFNNFGYSIFYYDGDDVFNPTDFTIGFGTKIRNNLYIGASWNKYRTFDLGLIYRPFNPLSIGITTVIQEDEDKQATDVRLGFALRPLGSRLTFGLDMHASDKKYEKEEGVYKTEITKQFHPFLSIRPLNGISFNASSAFDSKFEKMTEVNLSINFHFDKEGGVNIKQTQYQGKDESYLGVGFANYSQKRSTCLKKPSKDKTNYVRMSLGGQFIEEKPKSDFFTNIFGETKGVQLKGWLDEITKLTEDDNVNGLIIDLKGVSASLSKRSEMRAALNKFKSADKSIYVYSEYGISNSDYYLISMADEIYVGPMTGVDLRGLNMEVQFMRGLLDTLSIVPEVYRVNSNGKSYKTAGDGLLNRTMSDEMRENYTELLGDLFNSFVDGISQNKGWSKSETIDAINNGPYMNENDAIEAGLINGAFYPDEFDKFVKELDDKKSSITKWNDLDRRDDYVYEWNPKENEKIAVIYAVGGIISGDSNPGPQGSTKMGDKTIKKAIKAARENDDIKAIVLRIDSGGGSAIASDKMWREILETTETDTSNIKPFIASMSGVAASGGYYIACQADSIIAEETTITGSIGVIGVIPNFSQLMNRIGINYENIQMGDHADFGSWSGRLANDYEKEAIQSSINNFYTEFKDRVTRGRYTISEEDNVDDVAMGRVFTGKRASELDLTLVDRIGGYYDAIEMAKNAAGIDGDVDIIEYPKGENKMNEISLSISSWLNQKQDIRNSLPKEIADELEIFDMIPVIMDDEVQYILPYKITID